MRRSFIKLVNLVAVAKEGGGGVISDAALLKPRERHAMKAHLPRRLEAGTGRARGPTVGERAMSFKSVFEYISLTR